MKLPLLITLILLLGAPLNASAKVHSFTPTETATAEITPHNDAIESPTPDQTPDETPTPTFTGTAIIMTTEEESESPTASPILERVSLTATPSLSSSDFDTPIAATPDLTVPSPLPGPNQTPAVMTTPNPTDAFRFDLSKNIQKPDVTVIPNPAWGAKLSFRVMLPSSSLVRIRIYNHNLEFFAKIEKVGNKVFDILWSLKHVPEGLYYYQVQVVDQNTGKITKLPLANFAVMK